MITAINTHTHKHSEASLLLCYYPTWSLNFTVINGYNDIRPQNADSSKFAL